MAKLAVTQNANVRAGMDCNNLQYRESSSSLSAFLLRVAQPGVQVSRQKLNHKASATLKDENVWFD